jgi:hypothetical protein
MSPVKGENGERIGPLCPRSGARSFDPGRVTSYALALPAPPADFGHRPKSSSRFSFTRIYLCPITAPKVFYIAFDRDFSSAISRARRAGFQIHLGDSVLKVPTGLRVMLDI